MAIHLQTTRKSHTSFRDTLHELSVTFATFSSLALSVIQFSKLGDYLAQECSLFDYEIRVVESALVPVSVFLILATAATSPEKTWIRDIEEHQSLTNLMHQQLQGEL